MTSISITDPLKKFFQTESAGGIIMISFAALAMILANTSPQWYSDLTSLNIFSHSLGFWVNDVLMVFFFLLIGMELKKEALEGFLVERKQIILPLAAAILGMLVPAAIFLTLNTGIYENTRGWAIPCATDIAFAVAVLSIFAKRFPPAVKIFLLALAIFDDIGAILIIALYYNHGIAYEPFLFVIIACITLYLMNRFYITSFTAYGMIGIFLWAFIHECGIHTTLAGVIVGLAIPMYSRDSDKTPLKTLMNWLHPRVSFAVLPLFAFVSAGVFLGDTDINTVLKPLSSGIILGLFAGKQLGIFATAWLLIKLKIVNMPEDSNWIHIYAASVIAGIGFTMSLFIGGLAFESNHTMELVKIGVIAGSLLSAVWGVAVLKAFAK